MVYILAKSLICCVHRMVVLWSLKVTVVSDDILNFFTVTLVTLNFRVALMKYQIQLSSVGMPALPMSGPNSGTHEDLSNTDCSVSKKCALLLLQSCREVVFQTMLFCLLLKVWKNV